MNVNLSSNISNAYAVYKTSDKKLHGQGNAVDSYEKSTDKLVKNENQQPVTVTISEESSLNLFKTVTLNRAFCTMGGRTFDEFLEYFNQRLIAQGLRDENGMTTALGRKVLEGYGDPNFRWDGWSGTSIGGVQSTSSVATDDMLQSLAERLGITADQSQQMIAQIINQFNALRNNAAARFGVIPGQVMNEIYDDVTESMKDLLTQFREANNY